VGAESAAAPSRCPDCGSNDLKTTSKVVTVDSYWRCCGCGTIWNAGRLQAGTRNSQRWPYRR